MRINNITVHNFRILHNSTLDFRDPICLLLGRNNTGKTSFMVLVEKFLRNGSFNFDDFSVQLRDKLLAFDEKTDENELSIRMIFDVAYTEEDNLSNLSEFFIDLSPECNEVHLLFECAINKKRMLKGLSSKGTMSSDKFIQKHISEYLEKSVYTFGDVADLRTENRYRLIKKDFKQIDKLIDFEIIHAKRSVSSSEEKNGTKVLSSIATSYFNQHNKSAPDQFQEINDVIEEMDDRLDGKYATFFAPFLKNAKDFLNMGELKVVSSLKAREIVSDSSEVVYGDPAEQLPEYLNGLGHMNILYLLLNIEAKKKLFMENDKDIKLFFIEEPEAHTHPQLQYIFAEKIGSLLSGIHNMQTVISTHSPHIVSNHPFEHIRYMARIQESNGVNIKIKNFHQELSKKYAGQKKEFAFIKQYLTIESAELFFADKAIFIEGVSEGILIKYFMKRYDDEMIAREKSRQKTAPSIPTSYVPLNVQNITIIQAGANAKAFQHLIDFLGIPTLILTDIDTIHPAKPIRGTTTYSSCPVSAPDACNTSNATIKYYLAAPDFGTPLFSDWFKEMLGHKRACISPSIAVQYQYEECDYYPRSFEDAFINVNLDSLIKFIGDLDGLKQREVLESATITTNIYELTGKIIDKKSSFASSLLYIALTTDGFDWNTPKYITEGLKWIQSANCS